MSSNHNPPYTRPTLIRRDTHKFDIRISIGVKVMGSNPDPPYLNYFLDKIIETQSNNGFMSQGHEFES